MTKKSKVTEEEKLLLEAVDNYTKSSSVDFSTAYKELDKIYSDTNTYLTFAYDELVTAHSHLNKFCTYLYASKQFKCSNVLDEKFLSLITSITAHISYVMNTFVEKDKLKKE